MFGRALSALGLRGRIVGVVLVTAAAALSVAAVVLLGPLEHSLRNAELTTLKQQVPASARKSFRNLDPSLAYYYITSSGTSDLRKRGKIVWNEIFNRERVIGAPIGASEVAILGYLDAAGGHASWVDWWPDRDLIANDPADDAAAAFRAHGTGGAKYTLGSINGTEYARAAIPFTTTAVYGTTHVQQRWVLIVRKSLAEVSSAVAAVRTAFLVAALVALGLALALGVPLSARIVRRLRLLRQAALRLAQGREVHVPVDRVRDEVGDLARSFALMQTQLQHQEEARRAFVATASHELRTPVATLDGMLELLQEDLRGDNVDLDDAQAVLERARAQSHRLGRLAADLLDLSRIDAQVELRSEPVELSELSRAVLAEFEIGTVDRRISTILDDAVGPVWAMADPGSVARIVRILVDNAIRLSPEGSKISVELRNGKHASLSVADQGPGVPPGERELIFERFMRGSQTAGQAGFGLGLAIGRELAERMGGELVLEDHGGPGARFTLRLPVAQATDHEPVAVG